MTTEAQKIPVSISVKRNGKTFEIFMSYALLNRLTYIIKDVTNIPLVMTNPVVQTALLKELLVERDTKGKAIDLEEFNPEDADVPLDQVTDLLNFACEHVLDFYLAGLEKSVALQSRSQNRMSALKLLQTGPLV